jgi:SET domain-containing protein
MKKHVLDSLYNESYVCLNPSKVCEGVGVFALRDIPSNTYLFYDMSPDVDFIRWETVSDLPQNVIEYLRQICIKNDVGFYLSKTYNNISFAHYVNHSDTPNAIYYKDLKRWKTLRSIEEGEEILCKYNLEDMDW